MAVTTLMLLPSRSVVSDSARPHRRQPTRLPVPGILQARALEWVAISFPVHGSEKGKLCLTLRDPLDCSPPGSPVPGILQARTPEWAAISSSSAWKWKVRVKSLSRVRLLVTPWTAAHQAPPSLGFPRQEHWSGVPLPSPVTTQELPKEFKFRETGLLQSMCGKNQTQNFYLTMKLYSKFSSYLLKRKQYSLWSSHQSSKSRWAHAVNQMSSNFYL